MKHGRLAPLAILAVLVMPALVPAARAADTVVPFKLVDGFCLVQVRLAGAGPDRTFLFDTGMNITAIDSALAAELGLVGAGGESADKGGNATDVAGAKGSHRVVQIPRVSLAGIVSEACPAGAIDLAPLRRQTGLPIDGILGANFLKPFAFTLDYAARTITFHGAGGAAPGGAAGGGAPGNAAGGVPAPPKGAVVLALFEAPTPFLPPLVPLRIGKAELWGAIDCGAAGGLYIPLEVLDDLKLPEAERVSSRGGTIGGVFGVSGGAVAARLPSVRLGDFEIRRLPVESTAAEFALLGYDVLRHFRVTIDNPRNRAVLEPVDAAWSDNVEHFGLAAVMDAGGRCRLSGVWIGSPADRAGLQPGARLVTLDGVPVDSLGAAGVRRKLNDPAVRGVSLEIDGDSGLRTVRLEKAPRFPPRDPPR